MKLVHSKLQSGHRIVFDMTEVLYVKEHEGFNSGCITLLLEFKNGTKFLIRDDLTSLLERVARLQ